MCIAIFTVNREVQQDQLVHQDDHTTAIEQDVPTASCSTNIEQSPPHNDCDLSFDGDLYAERFKNNPIPETVFNQVAMVNAEWQAAFLLKLRQKYFLPFDALLCVSDLMNEYSERRIQEIQVMTPSFHL